MIWRYVRKMAEIALIVGSVRRNRQGIKVARWMEKKPQFLSDQLLKFFGNK
jgi:hypothetical protein